MSISGYSPRRIAYRNICDLLLVASNAETNVIGHCTSFSKEFSGRDAPTTRSLPENSMPMGSCQIISPAIIPVRIVALLDFLQIIRLLPALRKPESRRVQHTARVEIVVDADDQHVLSRRL